MKEITTDGEFYKQIVLIRAKQPAVQQEPLENDQRSNIKRHFCYEFLSKVTNRNPDQYTVFN